jgi:hypothetical protein
MGNESKKNTSDQSVDDYPDLSSESAVESEPEPVIEAADEVAPESAENLTPRFNSRKQFSMCWHNGLKAYLQDGVIYDRGSKEPIGTA